MIDELEQLNREATPAPWKADLDMFEAGEITACVTDEKIDLLALIDTAARFYVPSDGSWNATNEQDKSNAWDGARKSQALSDARLIAATRNALPGLLQLANAALRWQDEKEAIKLATMQSAEGTVCTNRLVDAEESLLRAVAAIGPASTIIKVDR